MMRTLASVALFIVCYYNANSQITVDWNSFSFEDEKLNLTIEGVESILFLEKNKAVSKKQSLLHPSVKSLDLKNEDGAVIGKLTSNGRRNSRTRSSVR